ncbi:MAG: chemotaxis protein CheA [Acidobacteria bacterium]|nr:chemotaxis protein CheA [Acidobacteriota bacterium]
MPSPPRPESADLRERLDGLALELALRREWDATRLAEVGSALEAIQRVALRTGWSDLSTRAGDLARLALAVESGDDATAVERRLQAGVISLQRKLQTHQEKEEQEEANSRQEEPDLGILASDEESVRDFLQESREHLGALETELLDLERRPGDGELINGLFRRFHTIKGLAGFVGLRDVGSCAHGVEELVRALRDDGLEADAVCIDLLLESTDYLRTAMDELERALNAGEQPHFASPAALLQRIRYRETTPVRRRGDAEREESAETEVTEAASHRSSAITALRVRTDKLDTLIETAGELVIAQTLVRLDPTVERYRTTELSAKLGQLARLTQEVQTTAMSLRLVPLGVQFDRVTRLVRDLARQSGKRMRLEQSGGDVEVDKTIVEGLTDPLLHIVRNAVDHGVETPEERESLGKDPEATIRLTAIQGADRVVVEVQDDGRGIDCDKVRAKAVERGLIRADDELTREEIQDLIFAPGFSTSEHVGDLSGRGVGMDVVHKSLQALRGSVEIESQEGRGSLFRLLIPLTLALVDGLILGVGHMRYVAPLFAVREIFRPTAEMLSKLAGREETVTIRGRLLPIARLHALFGLEPRSRNLTDSLLVVTEGPTGPYCLAVDDFQGKQEVVIKALGGYLPEIPGVAGASILGDGGVGLILDLPGLARQAGIMQNPPRKGERQADRSWPISPVGASQRETETGVE